jgi:creatinine amidohydrolase
MMMHLRLDLVRDGERPNFVPPSLEMEGEWVHLRPEGRIGFGWQTQDLNPKGASGNALDADAERGRLTIEHAVERFIELLREVERFPLSKLRPGPLDDQ